MGESETGGPVMNVVPRQGGNVPNGTIFTNGAWGGLQSSNFTQELKDAGLTAPGELQKIWDLNGTLGGPLRRDRLWYVVTGRYQGNRKFVEGMYYNKNAGNPASWTYEPDTTRRATGDGTWKALGLRLTWQATPHTSSESSGTRRRCASIASAADRRPSRPRPRGPRWAFRTACSRPAGPRR